MKYLGLAYFSPEEFAAMAPDEIKELVSQCPALDEKMRATGKVLISASLGDLDKWRTLRPRTGETRITDGPYTESKEVVGGLFIIEADSPDEALRIASMHPAATLGEEGGWAVELILLDFYLARCGFGRLSQEGAWRSFHHRHLHCVGSHRESSRRCPLLAPVSAFRQVTAGPHVEREFLSRSLRFASRTSQC
jgi:hypothetical protein